MAGRKVTTTTTSRDVRVLEPVTPVQQTFIELLLSGRSISDAALQAGISRRTATYWLHDPSSPVTIEYQKQASLKRDTFYQRMANLQGLALQAIEDALSADSPPHVRLKVATFIYEQQLQHLGRPHTIPDPPAELVAQELKSVSDRQHVEMFSFAELESLPD